MFFRKPLGFRRHLGIFPGLNGVNALSGLTLEVGVLCFTGKGLLVEVHEVGEDVLGDGLLVGQTLQQDHHLRLAHCVHALSGGVPTLPVHICGTRRSRQKTTV